MALHLRITGVLLTLLALVHFFFPKYFSVETGTELIEPY